MNSPSCTWRIATKLIGRPAKAAVAKGGIYEVTAARGEVSSGHIVFFDAEGSLIHVRANGTFETVTRVDD